MRFAGRVAIVTGAAGGIGSAAARALARNGARLALADRAPVSALAEELRGGGGACVEFPVDVAEAASVQAVVDGTLAAFGQIDILVNVAGVVGFGAASDLTEAEWDEILAINLKGTFLFCQAVIAPMRERRYGRIVNMGSVLGKNGGNPRPWLDRREQEGAGNVAYGVSKAGVHALTLYLAKELAADGITVNAVAPGPVASAMTRELSAALTDLVPVGRLGRAEEVAEAVLFLAAESSGFVTGEILDVNGGLWPD